MKTAVSVPDSVYQQAERLAQRTGRSRSEIYSTALREYVARHDTDAVATAVDRVLTMLQAEDGQGPEPDGFVSRAARRTLADVEW
jgi:metal-responsive CopG/Arc/MetJ family transcriptional regulator